MSLSEVSFGQLEMSLVAASWGKLAGPGFPRGRGALSPQEEVNLSGPFQPLKGALL